MVESNPNSPAFSTGNVDATPPTPGKLPETGAEIENEDLLFQFQHIVDSSVTLDNLLKSCAVLLSQQSECLGIWISSADAKGCFNRIHCITDENGSALWQVIAHETVGLIGRSASSGKIHARRLRRNPQHQAVTAPVRMHGETNFVLTGCFDTLKQNPTRQQWLMGIACQAIAIWYQQRSVALSEKFAKGRNDALTLFQALNRTQTTNEAALAIVNHLRRVLGVKQVSLSVGGKKAECKLRAISDVEAIDHLSESNQAISRACEQAYFAEEPLIYSGRDSNDVRLLPLENYCKTNRSDACLNLPLEAEEQGVFGAVLLDITPQQATQPEFVDFAKQIISLVANHLDVVLRANRGLGDVVQSGLNRLWRRKWTRTALLGTALLLLAMCIPLPYRIACDCELQPTVRRFVSAPHEGILEKTLAEHGDIVNQGDIIATMDGRTQRIELAGLRAEFEGARRRRDAARARGDIAQSHIAKSEMNRLASKIDLLTEQLKNLEIKSPIDGIVVSGDLEHAEGAPLELGQVLFEVGPLDQMLAEISIPESEIHYAEEGMPVVIKLNAFPFRNWTGTIEKIHPRTEIVNDEAVFVAEVRLPNDQLLLKPGLKGQAKIKSNTHPLGWNLFHSAWESVRYWMVW